MDIKALTASIAEQKPTISASQATFVIRTAFKALLEEVEAATEGSVKVPGLGVFAIRNVTKGEGEDAAAVRRVLFRAHKPKAAKTGEAEAAE